MTENSRYENINKFINSDKKISIPKYTITDSIFWLFNAQKDTAIFGKISFFKQMFLLYNEVMPDEIKNNSTNPKFISYRFGPYSFKIADILEELRYLGYINVDGRKNSRTEKFYLTSKGKKEAKNRLDLIPKEILKNFQKELKKRRITWDQLGNEGLLNYVYKNYPDFTEKSEIINKISFDVWDMGRFG